uniref:Uncharacterized protein n=1 Tax=Romanomermis culicivorax TaxID=13658 RepID=A0A915KB41_ROMCU
MKTVKIYESKNACTSEEIVEAKSDKHIWLSLTVAELGWWRCWDTKVAELGRCRCWDGGGVGTVPKSSTIVKK